VQDLDREVLATLAQDLLELLADHLSRPVMGIHDVVADFELDVLDLHLGDLEVLQVLFH
jgi:hypothetical protein